MNRLYYGDNLDILRRYVRDESVDLIYLDPPFNSKQDYSVLSKEHSGTRSASQIKAFTDSWHWDKTAAESYQQVVEGIDYPPANVTFKKTPKAPAKTAVPLPLPLEAPAVSKAAR